MDFFLDEAQFSPDDIHGCLDIFSKNLDDLKARLNELTSIGAPITVQALIKSKTDYLKYVKKFCIDGNQKDEETLLSVELRLKKSRRKTLQI